MSRKTCLLGIFILWIAATIQCNPTGLPTRNACSDTHELCGNKLCYDPTTEFCSEIGSVVTCINACEKKCYDFVTHVCIRDKLCKKDEVVCEVKYNNTSGAPIDPPQLECYDPLFSRCLNHTICYKKDRVCNGQCILNNSSYLKLVCANDGKTLCNVSNYHNHYIPNQIQLCNGVCYDTERGLRHCVNGSKQCVFNCAGRCYDATTQVCVNDTVCNSGQVACLTNYNSSNGYPLPSPKLECYNPWSWKCINGTLCQNHRICNGQCITGDNATHRVCANDRRTICNVTNHFNTYRHYQMHVCKGKCFDTNFEQCINESVSCTDNTCDGACYDSSLHVCINNILCSVNEVCEVRYNNSSGAPIDPPQLECYNPWSSRCLNHILCVENDRVCNGQCILNNSSYPNLVCANDGKTLCNVIGNYRNCKRNQIQVCDGSCFDAALYECVNGSVECRWNCSGHDKDQIVCHNGPICPTGWELCESGSTPSCYDPLYAACFNGTVCSIGYELCKMVSPPKCYDPLNQECLNGKICSYGHKLCERGSTRDCYNPLSTKCLNGTVCPNNRACGKQCISNDHQVCANDKQTVCNVNRTHDKYRPNQIQLCHGVCYDSLIQECSGEHVVLCAIDHETQQCVQQNINSSATTATTLASPSISTINSISSFPWTSTSDLSTSISSTNSPIPTSDAEASSNSATLVITTGTASPSISSTLTSLLTTPIDSSTEPFFYETETIAMTGLPVSSDDFTAFLRSSSPSKDTNIPSIFSISSSVSVTTETDPDALITSTDTSSSRLSYPWNTFTTESSSQTTISFIPTFPSEGSCCAAKECTNNTDCCVPHVEYRCYRHSRTRDYNQACKAIVIGENDNDSFVVAIAINDEKVIVINKNHFFLLLLSMEITFLLLLLIIISCLTVIYHKQIAITFRLWYRFVKEYSTKSQRKQWEDAEKVRLSSYNLKPKPDLSRWNSKK